MIAVLAMGALVLITAANVAIRYFTSNSIAWTEEISIYLMVVVALAGSAYAAAQDRHMRVTVASERGGEARRLRFALFSAGTSTLLLAGLTALMAWTARDEYLFGETSAALAIPRWWYTASLVVLSAVLTIRSAQWGFVRASEARRQAGGTGSA